MAMVWLAELHHLYQFMRDHGIQDRNGTDDPWALKHLDQFKCFTVEDVKHEFNRWARLQGRSDLIER
jgi:hypothetical protein